MGISVFLENIPSMNKKKKVKHTSVCKFNEDKFIRFIHLLSRLILLLSGLSS